MSKCAKERVIRYLWLVARTLVFILVPMLLVLLVDWLVLILQDYAKGHSSALWRMIKGLHVDSGLASYTLLLAFLGVILGLVRHIASLKSISIRMVRALEKNELEEVRDLYERYESLPLRFLWPSQRIEFYRQWAEEILPNTVEYLEREELAQAIKELSKSPLTGELVWLLESLVVRSILFDRRFTSNITAGLSELRTIMAEIRTSNPVNYGGWVTEAALSCLIEYLKATPHKKLDRRFRGKLPTTPIIRLRPSWEWIARGGKLGLEIKAKLRQEFYCFDGEVLPLMKEAVEYMLSKNFSSLGFVYRNGRLESKDKRIQISCVQDDNQDPAPRKGKATPSNRTAHTSCKWSIEQRFPSLMDTLHELKGPEEKVWQEASSVPTRVELCRQPLLLRFIPSIELPLPKELQSKVFRLYLSDRRRALWKGIGYPEEWGGRQRQGDYHAEVAWRKAGIARLDRLRYYHLPEKEIISTFDLESLPFRAAEKPVGEWFADPLCPDNYSRIEYCSGLIEHLKSPTHQVVFGGPGSGKTWLAQMLHEELDKDGLTNYMYNIALKYETLPKDLRKLLNQRVHEKTFLILSEAEELIKIGKSAREVWEILSKILWSKDLVEHDKVFIKLILPDTLELFVRNSISALYTSIEPIQLRWDDESLKRLWRKRITQSSLSSGRSLSSILRIIHNTIGGYPSKQEFVLVREWRCPDGTIRNTEGIDEYLVSLASGSPKCLMALGRRFLEHIAYDRKYRRGYRKLEEEIYESVAALLEAYYGMRANPIPECQDVIR